MITLMKLNDLLKQVIDQMPSFTAYRAVTYTGSNLHDYLNGVDFSPTMQRSSVGIIDQGNVNRYF